ncbi:anaerobic nitric oxide reductase transcription regulator norR [Vibrio sp. JCM 19236]|nr:anaerobic nitric oxide reductase transcription regulator norR [Vibrio sp. JCM 19236]
MRIIAATNRVMHEEVKAGKFRADLYHRLSVFPLFVPPLRERGKDIILLAGYFAEQCQHKLNVSSINLDSKVLPLLQNAAWDGNVRELEHTINRAAVLARAQSNQSHLTLEAQHFGNMGMIEGAVLDTQTTVESSGLGLDLFKSLSLKDAVEQFQSQLIQDAYNENQQNLSATAKQLGVNAGNLHRLMKRLSLK